MEEPTMDILRTAIVQMLNECLDPTVLDLVYKILNCSL